MRWICGLLVSLLALTACGKSENHDAARAPAAVDDSGAIPASMVNYIMNSGFPNGVPAILVMNQGNLIAFRAGNTVTSALDALRNGEAITDEPASQQQMQTALEKFLALENKSLESIVGSDSKALILVTPPADMCPPCVQAFQGLNADAMVGEFKVKKLLLIPPR